VSFPAARRMFIMLADLQDALQKNYYDPANRGLDMDARYQTYNERDRDFGPFEKYLALRVIHP